MNKLHERTAELAKSNKLVSQDGKLRLGSARAGGVACLITSFVVKNRTTRDTIAIVPCSIWIDPCEYDFSFTYETAGGSR